MASNIRLLAFFSLKLTIQRFMRSLLFAWIDTVMLLLRRVCDDVTHWLCSHCFAHIKLIFMMLSTQNLNSALFSCSRTTFLCILCFRSSCSFLPLARAHCTIQININCCCYTLHYKEQKATQRKWMLTGSLTGARKWKLLVLFPFCILAILKSVLNVFEGFPH